MGYEDDASTSEIPYITNRPRLVQELTEQKAI